MSNAFILPEDVDMESVATQNEKVHAEHKARQMGRPIDWEDVKNDMEDLETYFQGVVKKEYTRLFYRPIGMACTEEIMLAREMFIKGMLINRNQFNGEDILEFIRAGR